MATKTAVVSALSFVGARASSTAVAQALSRALEIVGRWSVVDLEERFDRGKGPTGLRLVVDGDPVAWVFPGKAKMQIRSADPEWLAAGFSRNVTPGDGSGWVHLSVRGHEDVPTAVALLAVAIAEKGRVPG